MEKTDSKEQYQMIRFIFEGGTKLEAQALTIATASCIYHRFYQECKSGDYDPYMIAATALYLAGKVEEDHLKIKDVINVCFKMLHKDSGPLEADEKYWSLRDSIVRLELLILRMLKFQVSFTHPHKYLLHYIKSLIHWLPEEVTQKIPLFRTSWGLVQDFCHDSLYLEHRPEHVAIAALYLTLQCYGVQVPYNEDAVLGWYESFAEDLSKSKLWEIVEDLMNVSLTEVSVVKKDFK